MKLLKVFSAIALTAALAAGCKSKTPKELIVNKWQISEMSGGPAEALSDSIKAGIKKAKMEFTADGKFHLIDGLAPYDGTYSISEDGKLITMTGVQTETDTIKEISADRMVVTDSTGFRWVAKAVK
jgi:hypothetical protein